MKTKEEKRAYNAAYCAANAEKIKTYRAAYRVANRERIKASEAAYRAAHKREIKAYHAEKGLVNDRMKKYGLSPEAFQLMLLMQRNACGICKEIFSTEPHVDHCHKTGEVRGLLCKLCNNGLGFFRDSSTFLKGALGYLEHRL